MTGGAFTHSDEGDSRTCSPLLMGIGKLLDRTAEVQNGMAGAMSQKRGPAPRMLHPDGVRRTCRRCGPSAWSRETHALPDCEAAPHIGPPSQK